VIGPCLYYALDSARSCDRLSLSLHSLHLICVCSRARFLMTRYSRLSIPPVCAFRRQRRLCMLLTTRDRSPHATCFPPLTLTSSLWPTTVYVYDIYLSLCFETLQSPLLPLSSVSTPVPPLFPLPCPLPGAFCFWPIPCLDLCVFLHLRLPPLNPLMYLPYSQESSNDVIAHFF
jgi:hypothetical protein